MSAITGYRRALRKGNRQEVRHIAVRINLQIILIRSSFGQKRQEDNFSCLNPIFNTLKAFAISNNTFYCLLDTTSSKQIQFLVSIQWNKNRSR
jgi:hypothetical protein